MSEKEISVVLQFLDFRVYLMLRFGLFSFVLQYLSFISDDLKEELEFKFLRVEQIYEMVRFKVWLFLQIVDVE